MSSTIYSQVESQEGIMSCVYGTSMGLLSFEIVIIIVFGLTHLYSTYIGVFFIIIYWDETLLATSESYCFKLLHFYYTSVFVHRVLLLIIIPFQWTKISGELNHSIHWIFLHLTQIRFWVKILFFTYVSYMTG